MDKRRNATRDVWRAVVFAGAMLGCSSPSKPPPEEPMPSPPPEEVAPQTPPEGAAMPPEEVAAPMPPDAAPPDAAPPDAPKKRPRPTGGKPEGRGFLLV